MHTEREIQPPALHFHEILGQVAEEQRAIDRGRFEERVAQD